MATLYCSRRLLPVLALILALLAGCGSTPEGEEARSFVITKGSQLGDLYLLGELTDSKGNRWNVWLIPGVVDSILDGGEQIEEGYDFATEPAEKEFWENRYEEISDGFEFAFVDSIKDFLFEGIGEDYETATENISANIDKTPFAWIPRIIGNAFWGYLLKPLGRIVFGPCGMVGGIGYSLTVPLGQLLARPVGGLVWMSTAGIAVPIVKIALHQPIYLFSIINREPSLDQDGSFGLSITSYANGPPKPARLPEKIPEAPGRQLPWSAEDHEAVYPNDDMYRRGYDYGYQRGLEEGQKPREDGPEGD